MSQKSIPDLSTDADTVIGRDEAPSARHADACLVVIRGARLGARVVLDNAQLTIGRDHGCDFQLAERSISRAHCRITRHADVYWLEDLESTNHTHLNDKPIRKSPLRDGDQIRIGSSVLKFIDAGNIEADYHSELHENAVRDALTGLFNRRYLLSALDEAINRYEKHPELQLALAIIDIDHFKYINDELGHLGGDSALKQLTRLLDESRAPDDKLARIGGEEFALLANGEMETIRDRLEMLRSRVAGHGFEIEGRNRPMTISAGLAFWDPSSMESASDLLRAADRRLYRAKNEGRNRIC